MAFEDVVRKTEGLAVRAIGKLDKKFDAPLEETKRAFGILTLYKGLIQAANNRYGLQYRIVKDLADNPEDLKKIIQVSLPHINPVKQIEKK